MDIKQLRFFKKVADAGSVSRAAAALSVAQPAVSRQIAALEEALGTPLFFRNGRGVKLTDAGAQLYQHTNDILEAVRLAEQDVRETMGVARGTLLIGSMPSVVRRVAPPLVRRVARTHPQLQLEVTEGLSGYVNEWLSNGLLDIAIIHEATRTQHFLTEPLMQEAVVFVSADADTSPITLREVTERPLILPRKNHGLRLMLERTAAHHRLTVNVKGEVDSLSAIRTLVRDGFGETVLPSGGAEHIPGLTARAIVEPSLSRTLLLATSSQRPVSQTTRAVIAEAKSVVRGFLDDGSWPGAARYGEPRLVERKSDAPVVVATRGGLDHAA